MGDTLLFVVFEIPLLLMLFYLLGELEPYPFGDTAFRIKLNTVFEQL